ncbi:MAG TPA: hypothetical protein VGP16_08015, partial [Asanoa sp.]|nr:hypothetical protein [Asanoa sp.]
SPSGLASGSPEGPQAQADLKIGESLKAMTKAMEAGDEAGFVAPAADKYVFDRKPDRYLVYVAGPAEWKKWFGGGQEDWVIGYAIETTENRSDIVLRADEIDGGDAEALMKHEMGHVATRGVPHPSGNAVWWLIEGIAEYVEWDGRGLGGYDGRQDVRRFLREKRFAGDPALVAPTDDPDDWEVNADYGIGFYYTRCIADRFGQDRLLAFTEAVLHDGDVVAPAATNTLGGSWPDITKRCLTYTKRAVGL